jgi:hypothetical protein
VETLRDTHEQLITSARASGKFSTEQIASLEKDLEDNETLKELGAEVSDASSDDDDGYPVANTPEEAAAQFGDTAGEPTLTPQSMNHSVEHSTVVTNDALKSLSEQMAFDTAARAQLQDIDDQIREERHEEQLAALGTINTAVMEVNDNLKGQSNLLSNRPLFARAQAQVIERLGESNPKTAKLFERGLISLDQMQDRAFVEAMEKSLTLREQREGTLKSSGSARQSSGPTEYTRTVERSKGVYQYRRPHFSTSPYFAE